MSSNSEGILWASRSGLVDRTPFADAARGSSGPVFVARIGDASAFVSIKLIFSTSFGL